MKSATRPPVATTAGPGPNAMPPLPHPTAAGPPHHQYGPPHPHGPPHPATHAGVGHPPPHAGGPPPPHIMPYLHPAAGGAPYPPPPPHYGMPPHYPPHMPAMPPLQSAVPVDTRGKANGSETPDHGNTNNNGEKTTDQQKSGEQGGEAASGGLDLLASLALPVGKKPADDANHHHSGAMLVGGIDISTTSKKPKKKSSRADELNPKEKLYVEKVRDCDVLCGRGGKSNHHAGNKRYRQVVSEMKRTYQSTGAKTAKTDLSRAIVEHVVGYGGRFIKREEVNGQYFLLTKAQARRKTSQALRETKELKWTM